MVLLSTTTIKVIIEDKSKSLHLKSQVLLYLVIYIFYYYFVL